MIYGKVELENSECNNQILNHCEKKIPKYGGFSGPYFPVFGLNTEIYSVFSPNTGSYRPEKTPYLHTFHAVNLSRRM